MDRDTTIRRKKRVKNMKCILRLKHRWCGSKEESNTCYITNWKTIANLCPACWKNSPAGVLGDFEARSTFLPTCNKDEQVKPTTLSAVASKLWQAA